ncbi:RNA-directed DNA polymerase reverse transcriptase family protein [Gossypium australe]|uniref:RNA-directed DNA polymerase reverse transcriptase family protein n=1 Tax=Gossypium australe TaxID=47621 RepID=A0A5B6WJ63_9ROSI|nr:RNA-directed DNA polymerase reverse transcriptase family protein [Gossypium australe]
MGFRSLTKFNLALLVMQGWHLMTNTNTLLGRSLKAKIEFHEFKLGSLPLLYLEDHMVCEWITPRGFVQVCGYYFQN